MKTETKALYVQSRYVTVVSFISVCFCLMGHKPNTQRQLLSEEAKKTGYLVRDEAKTTVLFLKDAVVLPPYFKRRDSLIFPPLLPPYRTRFSRPRIVCPICVGHGYGAETSRMCTREVSEKEQKITNKWIRGPDMYVHTFGTRPSPRSTSASYIPQTPDLAPNSQHSTDARSRRPSPTRCPPARAPPPATSRRQPAWRSASCNLR